MTQPNFLVTKPKPHFKLLLAEATWNQHYFTDTGLIVSFKKSDTSWVSEHLLMRLFFSYFPDAMVMRLFPGILNFDSNVLRWKFLFIHCSRHRVELSIWCFKFISSMNYSGWNIWYFASPFYLLSLVQKFRNLNFLKLFPYSITKFSFAQLFGI